MDTKAAQRQLVGLITQHLSESIPVTRILTYKPDKNGSVSGKFESLNRVFNFVFSGNDVRYKPAMNADSALFSELYLRRFDAAPATPRGTRALPKCTSKSYSCKGNVGVRCLPLNQNCKIGNSAIGNERLNKIKNLSKLLVEGGNFSSRLESDKDKIMEQRMALAVENRVKKGAKKTVPIKESPVRAEVAPKQPEPVTKQVAPTPRQIPIQELNKGLDQWAKHIEKLPEKERSSIPNIEDNYTVAIGMKSIYGRPKAANSPDVKDADHIAVVDSKGLMQSAMYYTHSKKEGVKIGFLATAPWNLQKDHPNKQKGSGAKAIVEAVKKSKELGYGGKISLQALAGAVPFYKHLGFKANGKGYTLTPKAAEELLKKYGA